MERRTLQTQLPLGADYLQKNSSSFDCDWTIVALRLTPLPAPRRPAPSRPGQHLPTYVVLINKHSYVKLLSIYYDRHMLILVTVLYTVYSLKFACSC